MTNIVMVTKDRRELFNQAINSLYTNTDESNFNLLVLDDGSEPRVKILHKSINYRITRMDNSDHVLGNLKSIAISESLEFFGGGDFLCLCDNDCFFKLGWLEEMIKLVEGTEPLGFILWGGQNHPFHNPQSWKANYRSNGGLKTFVETWTLAGTHFFMRWKTWNRFFQNFQSEGPGVCRGEDVQFCKAIKASGGRIGVPLPEVVIDCGLTQTGGTPSPGIEVKKQNIQEGVLYL